jgi:hypothetical protein
LFARLIVFLSWLNGTTIFVYTGLLMDENSFLTILFSQAERKPIIDPFLDNHKKYIEKSLKFYYKLCVISNF